MTKIESMAFTTTVSITFTTTISLIAATATAVVAKSHLRIIEFLRRRRLRKKLDRDKEEKP